MSEQSPFGERGDLKPRQGSFLWKNGKKSWKDLQVAVKQTKSVQQSLVNRVPHSFTFCENKLYFLAVPFGSRENTIHYVDLPGPHSSSIEEQEDFNSPLLWKPLLDSFKISRSFSGYSREEQLLRERKRLGAFGITAYDFDETCRRFMFSASSSLYTCTDWRVDEEVKTTKLLSLLIYILSLIIGCSIKRDESEILYGSLNKIICVIMNVITIC